MHLSPGGRTCNAYENKTRSRPRDSEIALRQLAAPKAGKIM